MFVVFEGIDGSGTTTQLRRVAAALRARGHAVHETREPSGGPVGRLVREALRARGHAVHETREPSGGPVGRLVREALRARGRAVHETREPSGGPVGRLVREALRADEHIDHRALALLFAADRVDHITREIQPALRSGAVVLCDRYLGSSLIYQGAFCDLAWVREINRHAPPADLTLVLDVSAEEAHRRRAARGAPAELFEDVELQARLAEAYRSLPALLPEHAVQVVDGTGPPEAVESGLVAAIVARL